jgi:hypothetical protein
MKGRKLVTAAALAIALISVPAEADHLFASLTIDPDASRSPEHLVITVTGTYTCGPTSTYENAQIEVTQAVGGKIIRGVSGFQPQCDGTLQTYEVNVAAENRAWKGGRARARGTLYIQDCNEFFCEDTFADASTSIRLGGGSSS